MTRPRITWPMAQEDKVPLAGRPDHMVPLDQAALVDPPDRAARPALVGPLVLVDLPDMVATPVQEDQAGLADQEVALRTDLHPWQAVQHLSWMGTTGVNIASTLEKWTGLRCVRPE